MLSWLLLFCLATIAHAQFWTLAGNLTYSRSQHTATLLPDGNVLVAAGLHAGGYLNSAELYNATTVNWPLTGNLTYARADHTATLLSNGNVLVAGADDSTGNTAEVYNATTGVWTLTGNLTYARNSHTATLLPNGNVLVAGGWNGADLASAEVYNPATGFWTVTGNLTYARDYHTATLLPNGNVLVTGGDSIGNTAEVYSASTGLWTVTDSLIYARQFHTATLLLNGDVLVAGGCNGVNCANTLNSAELYNSTSGLWTVTGFLTNTRYDHTATRLPNGNVLVAGGWNGYVLASAEVYNPATGFWTVTGNLTYARYDHTATPLPNGNVFVASGFNRINGYLNSAEIYNPTNTTVTATPTSTPTSTSTTPEPTNSSAPTSTLTTPTPTSSSTSSTEATPTPFSSAVVASSSNAGAIAGGIIGGLVGLVLLVLLLLFLRSRYWNKKDVNSSDYMKPMIPMASSQSQRSVSQVSFGQTDDIYISFNSLKLGGVLGQGHFGQVYQADYTGAQVAVKKSKGIDEKLILEEARMMKNLPPHPNVLHYYGVCQENGDFMMVTELCDKGNLAQYLRNNFLASQQCRQFCRQIASGMWHISKYGIIHRDLRAENILLQMRGNEPVAKVADFGLSRSLQSLNEQTNDSAYYRMTELKPIPVAWTAPEVMNDSLKYVAASDVWSFGVLMWEIYSQGAKPFEGTNLQLVATFIRDPIRNVLLLPRPNNCPDDIFAIMNSCWAFNPQDRPTFEQLYNQLS